MNGSSKKLFNFLFPNKKYEDPENIEKKEKDNIIIKVYPRHKKTSKNNMTTIQLTISDKSLKKLLSNVTIINADDEEE